LLLALLVLGGCSSTTFVYNRLDFLLPWYLDDYVELNTVQDQFLDDQLQPFLAWHRDLELPLYLQILIAAISLEFEDAWFRLEDRALDWLLALGERLTEEQVQEFLASLWEQQEKYEKKYLKRSDQEYRRDSYDSLVDNLQDYLGRLDKDQKQALENASEQLMRSDGIWLRERASWVQRMEGFMRREPGWQQAVRDSIKRRSETVAADYVELYEHNLGAIYAALAETLNSRTEKQDTRLRTKIADLREDLQTLVAQGQAQ
jgi:hypothetical protein